MNFLNKTLLGNGILLLSLLFLSCDTSLPPTLSAKYNDSACGVPAFSYLFSDSSEQYLVNMDTEFQLSQKVSAAGSDLERIQIITQWTHNLWIHDGKNSPNSSDPVTIIHRAMEGERFRCVEYAIVVSAVANAIGFKARALGIQTKDVEYKTSGAGHVVTEIFSSELNKWIFVDPQMNAIPQKDGIPLNGVEFKNALAQYPDSVGFLNLPTEEKYSYMDWISDYLYFFTTSIDNRVGNDVPGRDYSNLMLVPLGEKNPAYFQGNYSPSDYYTNKICDFYPVL